MVPQIIWWHKYDCNSNTKVLQILCWNNHHDHHDHHHHIPPAPVALSPHTKAVITPHRCCCPPEALPPSPRTGDWCCYHPAPLLSSPCSALLHSIEGGVIIGIQCKIRSREFIWSPFDLIERIKIKILCLFHKQIIFCPKKLIVIKTLNNFSSPLDHLFQKLILQTNFFYLLWFF